MYLNFNRRAYFLKKLKQTWDAFKDNELEQRGAALAYYAMFSLLPLLFLLMAGLGFFLQFWKNARQARMMFFNLVGQHVSPHLGDIVQHLFFSLQKQAAHATGVGLILLIITASRVFYQVDLAFCKIWQVQKQSTQYWFSHVYMRLAQELVAIVLMLVVGFLCAISVTLSSLTQILTHFIHELPWIGHLLAFIFGLVFAFLFDVFLFAFLFKLMPKKSVSLYHAIIAAFFSALLWEITKRILTWHIQKTNYSNAYGTLGTALVLMLWIYVSSQILFFGAQLCYCLGDDKN